MSDENQGANDVVSATTVPSRENAMADANHIEKNTKPSMTDL